MLKQEFPDLQYCPLLPRLVQLLLRYLAEGDVLKVAMNLIEEAAQQQSISNYLLLSPEAHERYQSPRTYKSLLAQSTLTEPEALGVLTDMLDNLLLLHTPAEYSGHLLSLYLACGLKHLAKMALIMLRSCERMSPSQLNLEEAQAFCSRLDFPGLLASAKRTKLSSSKGSASLCSAEAVRST